MKILQPRWREAVAAWRERNSCDADNQLFRAECFKETTDAVPAGHRI
jgi:hypothetical protein